jgi:peptidoglycan/LPS O-acetylase OafA/YrhL
MATPVFARVTLEPTYWTLTRELLFYALIAGLAFGFGKGRVVAGSAIWMVLAIVVNVFIADASHFAVTGWRSEVELITNAQFAYLFCSGMMLYRISIGDRSKLVFATLALAIVSAGFSEWADRGRFGIKEVGVAMIDVATVAAVVVWRPWFMRWSVLIWFGAISYSLYLIHQTLGFYIISHLQNRGVNANLAVLTAAACAIAVAALVQKFVEVPAQRVIRRWLEPGARQPRPGHVIDQPVPANAMNMPQVRSS